MRSYVDCSFERWTLSATTLCTQKPINTRTLNCRGLMHAEQIDACAKGGQVDRAFEVLQQMSGEGIQPNTTTYTALIDACGKAQQLERAFLVLSLMQQEGVKPNTATYTCLVDACGKAQQLQRAFEVLRMMQEARVQANTHTYNALVCSPRQRTRDPRPPPGIEVPLFVNGLV